MTGDLGLNWELRQWVIGAAIELLVVALVIWLIWRWVASK